MLEVIKMKVYILIKEEGKYKLSYYSIEGVFSTEKEAEFYRKQKLQEQLDYYNKTYKNRDYKNGSYDDYISCHTIFIKEFELDKINSIELHESYKPVKKNDLIKWKIRCEEIFKNKDDMLAKSIVENIKEYLE